MAYTGSVPDTGAHRFDWMERMACRTEDPDLFSDDEQEHQARIICIARCPVRAECLARVKDIERGLHRDHRDGVVAGLTYAERHRLDADAPHYKDDAELLTFDGRERCGTHLALLRHLWLNETIDSKCWSGEVMRDRSNRATPPAQTATTPAVGTPAGAPRPKAARRGSTPHERRIYALWQSGASDLDIARCMAVSVPAVERIRDRLGLRKNLKAVS